MWTALLSGLTGEAHEFANTLDDEVIGNFDLLGKALADRFPCIKPQEEGFSVTMAHIHTLKQNNKTLDEYYREGQRVRATVKTEH
ncbi:uncharacterized protein N7483_003733 [Penicillium malachiteum]|uniref:uncharacterized protein n=1 Tax=Penicillium malachiteum TaxID=1324776 RepID=UPI002546691F|nr:uncharacterized protein N7483_003733 [Penicillium malachiteum]KAJ5729225.1 hypothetical protein N7483_003733 [Penicillium malachiteum]